MLYFLKKLKTFTPEMSCSIFTGKKIFCRLKGIHNFFYDWEYESLNQPCKNNHFLFYRVRTKSPRKPLQYEELCFLKCFSSDQVKMCIAVISVSELIRPSSYSTDSSRHVCDAILVITKNLSQVAGVSSYLLSGDIKGYHLSPYMHQMPSEMLCCIWQHLQGVADMV